MGKVPEAIFNSAIEVPGLSIPFGNTATIGMFHECLDIHAEGSTLLGGNFSFNTNHVTWVLTTKSINDPKSNIQATPSEQIYSIDLTQQFAKIKLLEDQLGGQVQMGEVRN